MSEFGGGRCGRCGAHIHGEAVEVNGWWLHKECAPAPESTDPSPDRVDSPTDQAGASGTENHTNRSM